MLEILPIWGMRDRCLEISGRLFHASETMHPHAVRPQQVIERGVDGTEEGASLSLAVLVGKRVTTNV